MLHAIKKELMEGARTYKFLIIIAVLLFFAMFNPLMNKTVLPNALEAQYSELDAESLSRMVVSSQRDCVKGYLSDVFEILTLVITFSLSSLVAGEIKNKTFIFPRSSKKDFATLILAKFIVYSIFIMMAVVVATLVNYVYSGMLFGTDMPNVMPVIRSALLEGLYYIYVLAWVMLAGSFVKRPISAGFLALIPAYGTVFVSQLYQLDRISPTGVLSEASLLAYYVNPSVIQPLIITVSLIVALTLLTILRLEKIELSKR